MNYLVFSREPISIFIPQSYLNLSASVKIVKLQDAILIVSDDIKKYESVSVYELEKEFTTFVLNELGQSNLKLVFNFFKNVISINKIGFTK